MSRCSLIKHLKEITGYIYSSRKITDCIYSSWHLHLSYHHLRVWGFSSNTPRAVHPRQGYWSSPSGYCFFSSLCRQRMRGELKTFLSAAKHCGAIRRQHKQLQGGGTEWLGPDYYPLLPFLSLFKNQLPLPRRWCLPAVRV
jgi:hypothetical protein